MNHNFQDFSETAEPGPLILCNYKTNLELSQVQANERVLEEDDISYGRIVNNK